MRPCGTGKRVCGLGGCHNHQENEEEENTKLITIPYGLLARVTRWVGAHPCAGGSGRPSQAARCGATRSAVPPPDPNPPTTPRGCRQTADSRTSPCPSVYGRPGSRKWYSKEKSLETERGGRGGDAGEGGGTSWVERSDSNLRASQKALAEICSKWIVCYFRKLENVCIFRKSSRLFYVAQRPRVDYLTLRPSQVAATHSHFSVVYRTVPQAAKAALAGDTCAETTKNNRKNNRSMIL